MTTASGQRQVRGGRLQLCWERFVDLLFPPCCHACRGVLADDRTVHLCDPCRENAVPLRSPLCSSCGRPFPDFGGVDHLCGSCLASPPPFAMARGALLFTGTTSDLIHRFKYHGQVILRRPLALLAAEHLDGFVAEFAADLLLPVPLHTKRLRQRGFNQALLLAEIFSRRWQLPLLRHNLQRCRWTEPQVNLSAAARAENVRGAFSVAEPETLAGTRILLVDDVYTTGSTARECSRVLRNAGAAAVGVMTVARAGE